MTDRIRLFCIPYAGAGAAAYRTWRTAFGPGIEVRPLTLPGRESRLREAPVIDVAEVAGTIAAAVDGPYAIYGHSLGARLGFEVLRSLRDIGAPLPMRFYAAAARPPDVREDGLFDHIADLPEPEFLARMSEGGGIPEEVLAERELLDLVLPALRADLRWIDDYVFTEDDPLPVPIVTFAGSGDPSMSPELMAGWARHTSAGYRGHVLPGGHFFLHEQLPELVRVITADLAGPAGLAKPAATVPAVPKAASKQSQAAAHRVPLGDTGWSVWRDGLLRSTGFPASGLESFSAPEAAAAADALLADPADPATGGAFDEAFAKAVAAGARTAQEIACMPLLREAVTWQNTNALFALDHLADHPADEKRVRSRNERETVLVRYWQRYSGKNDTIGFFGPACWVTIDPESPVPLTAKPGAGLIRDRRVWIETWAFAAYADRIAEDPQVRKWLPIFPAPHMSLEDRTLYRPAVPPKVLSAAEAAAMAAADGRRAIDVIADLRASAGLHNDEDAYLLLNGLVDQGFLVWGADLPESLEAEELLRQRIGRIGDDAVRAACLAGLDRLTGARDGVSAAAGDPVALRSALSHLDAVFTDLTGEAAHRRPGQMYAGRAVCFEDTSRDLDLVFGRPVLDELAPALAILLQASRWLTAAIARAYLAAIRELYDELAGDGPVRLGDLFFLAQGSLWGSGDRPVDAVAAEFAARWADLFGITGGQVTKPVQLSSADLRERVMQSFPADRPGWSSGFVHSPDIQLCAPDVDAIVRGDYFAVLGEMHAAWGTFDCAAFTQWHPDVQRLADGMERDRGPQGLRLLYPPEWPRNTGRVTHGLDIRSDWVLAFSPTAGADRDRLLPAMAALVVEEGADLVAVGPDGHRWPILETFSDMLSVHAVDGFKLVAATAHMPRITVDRLVVNRETWRTTVGECGLTNQKGERNRYLAVRRWCRALNLPDRVYVKIGNEVKPFYVDLTSPQYATSLCNAVNSAAMRGGNDVVLTMTEMVPTAQDAWVPDGAGNRYVSELRLHITDAEAIDG